MVRHVGHVLNVRAVRSEIDDRGIALADVVDGEQVLARGIPGQRHVVQRLGTRMQTIKLVCPAADDHDLPQPRLDRDD